MKRAILVALGTATLISSAAALSVGSAVGPRTTEMPRSEYERSRIEQSARAEQHAQIEARYTDARSRCDALGGARRDDCLIAAHAAKGRALLESQAPYESRVGG